jgi:hypothetical protein
LFRPQPFRSGVSGGQFGFEYVSTTTALPPFIVHGFPEPNEFNDRNLLLAGAIENQGEVTGANPALQRAVARPKESSSETLGNRLSQLRFKRRPDRYEVMVSGHIAFSPAQPEDVPQQGFFAFDRSHERSV